MIQPNDAGEHAFHAPITTDTKPEKRAAKNYKPEGYKSAEEFLKEAREVFAEDLSYDQTNRDMALDDLKFTAMDQWDEGVKAAREAQGKPCMTINVLPQFIGQVIGDRRQNKTAIRVRPKLEATMAEAEARAGLIKSIEAYSRAERVYDAACEDQVTCGIGNFRINLDFADDDVFEQDIFIRQIPNPLAVIWDRMSIDPTGRDAEHCFVQDNIPQRTFEKQFKDVRPTGDMIADLRGVGGGWFENNSVRLCEYWQMVYKDRMMALGADGKVLDITGKDINQMIESGELFQDPMTGQPRIRKGQRRYARMHLITGTDILAGPYELPISRLPIIRVNGRETRVGDDRVRYSLIRWSKDAQRMKNYWRSVAVEKLAMAPKAQWIAEDTSVEGYEESYRNAHMSGDPLLKYKAGQQRPSRVDSPPIDAAILQEVQMNAQDIKDTTGLHDASLGIRSNEVSGKAIIARQQEGDVAVVVFHDNLNSAIQEAGDVINQLIPIAYDTTRTLRVIGIDDKEELMVFNDPADPSSIDLSNGKYDVSIETGPSYTTQRMEAATSMMEAIKVFPQLMEVAGDLVVEAQDWPGAHKIAQRLKKMVPPELREGEEGEEEQQQQPGAGGEGGEQQQPSPEEMMAMQQMQQAEQAAEAQAKLMELELREKEAKAIKAEEDARRAKAEADRAEAEAERAEIIAEATGDLQAAQLLKVVESPATAPSSKRGDVPRRAVRPQPNAKGPRK
jgi:hypothetical protein